MELEELRDGEIVPMGTISSVCALDDIDGDLLALIQRGHHPPWRLQRAALWEYTDNPGWPRRTYMRSVPWSFVYPDDPPCDRGPESILWMPCKRTDVGAVPVTVLKL